MNKKVAELINDQINKEFYSAYLYLEFANYYADAGLDGFENWYRIQAQEERDHAMLFYQYMHNNDEKVTLKAIGQPECELTDNMAPLKKGLEHEKYVTELIHTIYTPRRREDHDFRTMQMLDWFVKEQGEEEKERDGHDYENGAVRLRRESLYMLNSEMAGRVHRAVSRTVSNASDGARKTGLVFFFGHCRCRIVRTEPKCADRSRRDTAFFI